MRLLGMAIWDWKEDSPSRNNAELRCFHHAGAIGARLMLRAMEQEEKVFFFLSSLPHEC